MADTPRLKLYIVSSDADKPLLTDEAGSVFDIPIQAGAALTDKRICILNDLDDCSDSISGRNRRYSEATAMYWVYRHLDSEYVGIEHYRRRLDICDDMYSDLMDSGIDMITTSPMFMKHSSENGRNMSIEEHFRLTHYSTDWDLFMGILKKQAPNDYDLAVECFNRAPFHPCNINVYRSELYHEFSEWAFPICDDFYHRSPEKTDIFQHRDVGYIMERLSHLFVIKMRQAGKNIYEVPLKELKTTSIISDFSINLNNPEKVFDSCNEMFMKNQITNAHRLLDSAMKSGSSEDERIRLLARLFTAYLNERNEVSRTMFEYLPEGFRTDLVILSQIWNGFEQVVKVHTEYNTEETLDKLTRYITMTGFSKPALRTAMAIAEGRSII